MKLIFAILEFIFSLHTLSGCT